MPHAGMTIQAYADFANKEIKKGELSHQEIRGGVSRHGMHTGETTLACPWLALDVSAMCLMLPALLHRLWYGQPGDVDAA